MPDRTIGIISGGGELPERIAGAIGARGVRPLLLPIEGEGAQAASRYESRSIPWGGFGGLFDLLRAEGIEEIVFAGSIHARPTLRTAKLDWTTARKLPELLRLLATGDDTILSGIARMFEEEGVTVLGVGDAAPELLATAGPVGRNRPNANQRRQIAEAFDVIRSLGPHDVGQAVVVCGRRVVAVEGIEGTDRMVDRVGTMRTIGRLPEGIDGVLAKRAKPGQDLRFDLPTIGVKTVKLARLAGIRGIAVEAGRSVILDRDEVAAAADRHGLFVIGWSEKDGA